MSLQPYPKYKNSGAAWLGDVPEHWGVQRLKFIVEIKKRISGEEGFDVLSITQQGIKIKDIESNDGQLSMDYSKYQFVETGDFAMNHMDLLTGYIDISKYHGVTSPDYRVFAVRNEHQCLPEYLLFILQNAYRQKILYAFGQGASQLGRWRLPTEQFNDFVVPLPDITEQKRIVLFLHSEVRKIDELIVEQEKLISLLTEKRQAAISHAVTKGVDATASMKDSGVEWMGKTPKHWEIRRLKYCLSLRTEKTERRSNPVALENIEGWSGRFIPTNSTFEGDGVDFAVGDILFGKLRPYLAKVFLAQNSGEAIGDFHVLRPAKVMNRKFAFYQMLNRNFIDVINGSTFGAKMPRASWELMANLEVVQPPMAEQAAIAAFLDQEITKFDTLINEVNRAITLLKEHRTTLIYAVVTGRVRVQNCEAGIIVNTSSAQSLLFAEVANFFGKTRRWGKIVQAKGLYLASVHNGYADGIRDYEKQAAGPYNPEVFEQNRDIGVANKWFATEQDGAMERYRPGKAALEQKALFEEKFGLESDGIHSFLKSLVSLTDDQLEICATLYHCWLTRLVKKAEISEDILLNDFLNYSARKKSKFTAAQIRDTFKWMKRNKVTPEHKHSSRPYPDSIQVQGKQESLPI